MNKITTILLTLLFSLSSCQKNTPKGELLSQYYTTKQWDKVITTGEEILKTDSLNVNIMLTLIDANLEIDSVRRALYYGLKITDIEPNNHYNYLKLGKICCMYGDYENAMIAYKKTIALQPNYARAYIELGELYEFLEKKEEAINMYLYAISLFEEHDPKKFATEIISIGKYVATLDSTCTYAMNAVSVGYVQQDNLLEASKWLKKAIFTAPEEEIYHIDYISCLYHLQDYPTALDAIQQLIQLCDKKSARDIDFQEEALLLAYCISSSIHETLGNNQLKNKYYDIAYKMNAETTNEFMQGLKEYGFFL